MIHYTQCPSCGSNDISEKFSTKDFSITGEDFTVMECRNCTLLFTQDIPEEDAVAKYYQAEQYISHSDTSKGIINQLYHAVRKRTLRKKLRLVTRLTEKASGNLLDIGSGTGAFLKTMKDAGWNVTGLEPDAIARTNSENLHGIAAIEPDMISTLETASFDAITMWHVLEHVHRLKSQLTEIERVLKPGGVVFIAVPNHTSYDAAKYGPYWAAWDVPRHLYHFNPSSMRTLIKEFGLYVKEIKPMWFDSFYVSMLSEKYKNGKNNLVGAFFTGSMSNLKALRKKERCSSLIYIIEKEGKIIG